VVHWEIDMDLSHRQLLSVANHLLRARIVVEEIQWLGAATEHNQRIHALLEESLEEILDALGLRGPHGGFDSIQHALSWLVESKHLRGFLVHLRTPVLKPHWEPQDPSACTFSWDETHATWLYVENIAHLRSKAIAWQMNLPKQKS